MQKMHILIFTFYNFFFFQFYFIFFKLKVLKFKIPLDMIFNIAFILKAVSHHKSIIDSTCIQLVI